jgi:dTDP-glucose 4,6-dehydratase/UDP-glucuronate decarboxylase
MTSHQEIINRDISRIVDAVGNSFNRLAAKTLLITGPSGLIGSYLVDTVAYLNDSFLDKPCKVIGLHRSPIDGNGRLAHLLGRNDINLIRHNVSEPLDIKEKVHFIIHAAGRSAPAIFQAHPLSTIDVNVKGIRWLLELAVKNSVESFMYFSSGEVCANASPSGPRACYTESKRLAETLCSVYHRKYGVPVRIVRPFLIYGPGLGIGDPRVMTEFMRSGVENKPIAMLDKGESRRAYCYISDAAIAFWKILFSDYNGEPVNVGSDKEEVSIKQLAVLVHNLCGIKAPPTCKIEQEREYLKGAPKRVCPGITKTRALFGFDPEIGLREGLKRTIEWNKEKLGL